MKNAIRLILVVLVGLAVSNCSTYKIKADMSKDGVLNKTPKWYVKYDRETWTKYQEAATAVSPDLELAVKKSIIIAKAKLVDRINGEMNNQTTIKKDEAGANENLTVQAGSQDVIVNMIRETLARGYEVTKQEVFMTGNKSYRAYVMIELSKDEIKAIIDEINKKQVAVIKTDSLDSAADKVLNR